MRKVEGETLEIVLIRQARWCERECETVVGKVCESVLVAPSEKVLVAAQLRWSVMAGGSALIAATTQSHIFKQTFKIMKEKTCYCISL